MQAVEVISKDNCPYCVKAKQLLEKLNIEYIEKKIGKDITREELLERVPNARSVPQIFIGTQNIGGYQELATYIENTGFNGTGFSNSWVFQINIL